MGIINCTPDSFYPGSRRPDPARAIEMGVRMVEEGADILDVGGESSRPGAEPISADEELARIAPVIEGLLRSVDVPISVDTYKSAVAAAALELGAHIVNDISALRLDPALAATIARYDVPVVLMHMKGTPKTMQKNPVYRDVVGEVCAYFEERMQAAVNSGIKRERIILDPGIGFGKRLQHNYEILRRLNELSRIGRPILVGLSRKSFVWRVLGLGPEQALEGSLAAGTIAILNGAHILRVHDVEATRRAATIVDYYLRGEIG
ncbi:MAG: dihydropteroate synthase [Calditrichaeota bacterium]|nr:MAG: dihydropteroate synthase [Calditrichota bacterium]